MVDLRLGVVYSRATLLDSSALVALLDPRETRHSDVQQQLSALLSSADALFVSSFVIAETYRRLLYKRNVSKDVPLGFICDVFSGSFNVVRPIEDDETEAVGILKRFRDQQLSFTDAVSMAIMKRLGLLKVLTLDWHFTLMGFETIP